ncbi:MAG: hypothetical protein AAF597_02760, partial [Bacteroidota bacterium]
NPNTIILDDPSQDAVTIEQMQAADVAPRPPVNYTNGPRTLPAPLVLVNNLHPASIAQYNYSWAFRGGKRLTPCDPPDLNDNPDLEGELNNTPNPGELADILDEVNDAILGSMIAEQLGFDFVGNPLEGGDGNLGGGLPTTGGTPAGTPNTLPDNLDQTGTGVGFDAGQGTVILNNGGYGTQVSAQFNGQSVYNTQNFAQASNNFGPTSINMGMAGGTPGPGFSVAKPFERKLQRLLSFTQAYMPMPIPDPRGQRVTVRLRYELKDHEGQKETYVSLPIDVTIN